ncbi:MlaC/ttg2D family ABC transporter substrate-binding protein [Shewanella cyperi]|uniref:ABC transporter substrate-binding protein n=1 Tax=Shewanella cyperi TaxID=2814292 RepID=A0A974XLM7_9GAMM|nr:ABC transporter substrate-binding protein [Shewanella cyperi]QSX29533.1 ABC transporter substrate-binding protein [Shewanella cyperi]QSX40309.1 ABC transporter substrate-binding protein [Shewanella cyperi]
MFKVVLGLIMSLWLGLAQAAEVNTMDPYAMVREVSNNTFDRFNRDHDLIEANQDHLKVIVREELMPYIDYKYASYKVLGQYLKETTEDQRNRFVAAFEEYLVATYAQAFTEYTNQAVEFSPTADFAAEKMVEVNVQIIEKGRPPIKLLFKVRRLKDDSWKAFDLVAEGVSLLSSKQSEIGNIIRQQGIEAVINMLKEKAIAKVTRKDKVEKVAAQ